MSDLSNPLYQIEKFDDIIGPNADIAVLKQYTPPTYHEGKEAYVSFYAYHPLEEKLKRKKIKLNYIQNKKLRRAFAADLIVRLNTRLRSGWNPFIYQETKYSFTKIEEAHARWQIQLEHRYSQDVIRKATYNSYKSKIDNFMRYNKSLKAPIIYAFQLDRPFILEFLDDIYLKRKNSYITYNHYLHSIANFCDFMVERGYLKSNPTEGIKSIPKRRSTNERVIPNDILHLITNYLQENDKSFLLACYLLFYCFIRPTEMCSIRIKDINLKRQTLFISGEYAKNRQDAAVTLPKKVIELMIDAEVFSYPDSYLLFSENFKPGIKKITDKYYRDCWTRVKKELNIKAQYTFYNLKHTGITLLIKSGVDPLAVRDQARHSSLDMTERYTDRNNAEGNPELKAIDFAL
jgi:integrase